MKVNCLFRSTYLQIFFCLHLLCCTYFRGDGKVDWVNRMRGDEGGLVPCETLNGSARGNRPATAGIPVRRLIFGTSLFRIEQLFLEDLSGSSGASCTY